MQTANNYANDDAIEIDLQELFFFLLHRLWILLLFALIGGAIAFSYTKFLVTPMYQSDTSIYILSKQNNNGNVTYSDLQLGTQLTKDYSKLITSRRVMEGVINELDLEGTISALQKSISVTNLTDTRIIQISVKNPDPVTAQILADEVRDQASVVIKEVMDIEAVNIVDRANLPVNPVSPSLKKNVLIGAAVGFMLIAMIFVIQFLLDDSIKSTEDVEKYLGLSTLAVIPVFADGDTKKSGKHSSKKKRSDIPSKYESDFQEADDLEEEELEPVKPLNHTQKEE